jgi:hypothetical protein
MVHNFVCCDRSEKNAFLLCIIFSLILSLTITFESVRENRRSTMVLICRVLAKFAFEIFLCAYFVFGSSTDLLDFYRVLLHPSILLCFLLIQKQLFLFLVHFFHLHATLVGVPSSI